MEHYAGRPEGLNELDYTRVFIALEVVLLIPLAMIRKLKHLVPFSMVANLCIVVGFTITLYYMFTEIKDPAERHWGTSLKGLPIFFATVLFAMEGIGTVSGCYAQPTCWNRTRPRRKVGTYPVHLT